MADKTGIEWTDATWNPVTGCTEVSPGCDHCYAKTFAERWRGTRGHYFENGFDVQLRPDKLDQPLRWRKPRKIFVNSMSDLFHDSVPDEYIAQVFAVMCHASHHTFQVLTKRHARMRSLLSSDAFRELVFTSTELDPRSPDGATDILADYWPLPNVWLGVSAENQQWANIRIPALLGTPAAVRFVSAEPLLGHIDLRLLDAHSKQQPDMVYDAVNGYYGVPGLWRQKTSARLDWVIAGGESGPGARLMELGWACGLQKQCASAGVAFHFKQTGSVLAREWGLSGKGGDSSEWPWDFTREYPSTADGGEA